MISKAVVDFSAFEDHIKTIIVKELTVIDVASLCMQHYIFKSPRDVWDSPSYESATVRRHNRWLSTHFHGLNYFEGDVEYDDLRRTLDYICDNAQLIFASSNEKAAVLEKVLGGKRVVLSLESLGYQQQQLKNTLNVTEEDQCLIHRIYAPGFYCTQGTVRALAKWCSVNAESLDVKDATVRERTFGDWHLKSPSAADLARNGFVKYVSTKDSTKCVYCGIDLYKWEEGDDAFNDHKMNSPFCKFVASLEVHRDTSRRRPTQIDCACCVEDTADRFCGDGLSCQL